MIRGERVVVEQKEKIGVDDFGADIFKTSEIPTENVVVIPGATSSEKAPSHPNAVSVVYTLHFPATWAGSLRGLRILVRGKWYDVVGDPQPYKNTCMHLKWNMPVEVVRHDG